MSRALGEWPELLAQLQEGWTLRSDIRRTTRMYRGISAMLMEWAKGAGHIVERRNKAEPGRVLYHLRSAAPGETVGGLLDVPED